MINKETFENIDTTFVVGAIILALIALIGFLAAFGVGFVDLGDEQDFDYPEWADETGITDIDAMMQSQSQELQQNTYTLDADVVGEVSGEEQVSSLEYRYDPDQQRSVGVQTLDESSIETYAKYDVQEQFFAENLGTDNETFDRSPNQQPPFTGDLEFAEFLSIIDVEATDVVEAPDGEDAVVYESSGVMDEELAEEVEVEGEFHLSENGYFVFLELDIDEGEAELTSDQTLEIHSVGETTVEEPEWVETAREETDEIDMEEDNIEEDIDIVDPEDDETNGAENNETE